MLPHAANLSSHFGGYAFPMSAAAYRFGTLAAFASRAAVQAARFCGTAAVFMSTFLQFSAVYHSWLLLSPSGRRGDTVGLAHKQHG